MGQLVGGGFPVLGRRSTDAKFVGGMRARVVVTTGLSSILLADRFNDSVRDPLVDGSDEE